MALPSHVIFCLQQSLCGEEEEGCSSAPLWQEFCSPRQARTCRPFFPSCPCASSSLLLGRKAPSWEIKGIALRPHERQRFGGCVKFPREAFPVRAARSAQTGATRPRGREGAELPRYESPQAKVRRTFLKFAFLLCSKLLPKNVKVRLGGSVGPVAAPEGSNDSRSLLLKPEHTEFLWEKAAWMSSGFLNYRFQTEGAKDCFLLQIWSFTFLKEKQPQLRGTLGADTTLGTFRTCWKFC